MIRTLLKSKIHRATVTEANLHYEGSITIDEDLMDAADVIEFEKAAIWDVDNGSRFETYVIKGKRGSGVICLNGAAARMVAVGDVVIIATFALYDDAESRRHKPKVVMVDARNRIKKIRKLESNG
jgi:aspartate 1-decarboxylase